MSDSHELIQEIRPVQCVSLRGIESGVADDAAEFFFGRAINSKRAVTVPPSFSDIVRLTP